jgi:hypothetical protein
VTDKPERSFVLGIGEDGEPVFRGSRELDPGQRAEFDQRSAELNDALSTLVNLAMYLIIGLHRGERDAMKDAAEEISKVLAVMPRELALSLVNTLVGREAARVLDDMGGPDEVWRRFIDGDEAPVCTCGREDCTTKLFADLDPDNG